MRKEHHHPKKHEPPKTEDRPIPVTQYHLSADAEDVKIVFHAGNEDTAKLEYNGKIFVGRALTRENTPLGLVVSAQLERIPDLHSISLCLAVPEANCPSNARSIPISTFATFTTVRTTIAGPDLVRGQIRTYRVVPLKGNAW